MMWPKVLQQQFGWTCKFCTKKISNPFLHLSSCTSAFALRHRSIKGWLWFRPL